MRARISWCGEGDLFCRTALKTRKLYTSRRPKNTRSARNTRLSHTASHTAGASVFTPASSRHPDDPLLLKSQAALIHRGGLNTDGHALFEDRRSQAHARLRQFT